MGARVGRQMYNGTTTIAKELQDDEAPSRRRRVRRAGLCRAAEGALRDGPVEASDQIDGVELHGAC